MREEFLRSLHTNSRMARYHLAVIAYAFHGDRESSIKYYTNAKRRAIPEIRYIWELLEMGRIKEGSLYNITES